MMQHLFVFVWSKVSADPVIVTVTVEVRGQGKLTTNLNLPLEC